MIPLLLGLRVADPTDGPQVYAVVGTGAYYFREANPTFDDNKFGVHAGVGVARQRLFVEGRYHSVFDRGDSYFALTAGVRLQD
jgi:hypothetical protein